MGEAGDPAEAFDAGREGGGRVKIDDGLGVGGEQRAGDTGDGEGDLLVRRRHGQPAEHQTELGNSIALDELEPEVPELFDIERQIDRRQAEGAIGRVVQTRRQRQQRRPADEPEQMPDRRQLREAVVAAQLGNEG